MKKIAICFVIALILGTGVSAGQPDEMTTDITRIVISLDPLTARDEAIQAVRINGGTFVRETLDKKLIFNIPTASLNNQISVLTIPGTANIREDLLIKLPPQDIIEVGAEGISGGVQLIPNDPLYPDQWGMSMIGADLMWDHLMGDGIIVAVIDTGSDYNHEDLAAVDETLGWDFVNNDNDAMDDNGHGTHIAGIVAATMNNSKGVVGVAPNATVIPVKVCDQIGLCWTSDIADGVRYAVDNGAKIISLSLGGPSPDPLTSDATKYAVLNGALVMAAAGGAGSENPSYPAAYPWVLAVGALAHNGERAYYSNYGSFLDIMAPGGSVDGIPGNDILSTWPGNTYVYLSGTSMATPHVSGVAALYWSKNPGYTNRQVGIALLRFADDLGPPGWDKFYGYGRVDAYPPDQ